MRAPPGSAVRVLDTVFATLLLQVTALRDGAAVSSRALSLAETARPASPPFRVLVCALPHS